MQLRKLATATAVLALAAVAAVSGIGQVEAANRAFRGKADGVVTDASTPGVLVIDYTGNATHLGNCTRHEVLTFTGPGTFSGTIDFTAKSGDQVNTTFVGHFLPPAPGDTEVFAVGTYTIIGGTGKFAGATGSASFTASTPDFVHVTAEFDGTINY